MGLVNAQYDLRDADFPVIIMVAGDDRIAANAVVNRLNEWMDTRYIRTFVFLGRARPSRSARPLLAPVAVDPPQGRMGVGRRAVRAGGRVVRAT